MTWIGRRSLGVRMAALFSVLLLGIGVFMFVFFPARMADQARASAEHRANAVSQMLATALGPAIEFDDADNASSMLIGLARMPDARFGVVRRADGSQLAVWGGDAIPRGLGWTDALRVETRGDLLIVTRPIVGLGGGAGTLQAGFSLRALADERARTRRTVGTVTAAVLVIGGLATLVLAAFLIRPIRRLTVLAGRIARGEVPPQLPRAEGTDEVGQMTESLSVMLERLNEVNRQLQRASRHAGMAEVATGVLHNVGNVLNSVNVSVELMRDQLRDLPLARLVRLEELLGQAASNGTVDRDRVIAAIRYVSVVRNVLEQSRDESLRSLAGLRGHLEHIKGVVAMQNGYTRASGVVEVAPIDALIDEALELGRVRRHEAGIALVVEAPERAVVVDRHRVLQIVINLVSNARDAVLAIDGPRTIAVKAAVAGDALRVEVTDSGVGIAEDALGRIFAAGFTTKPRGHGFGLHSSALAARQLGGTLTAASPGPGRGATFTLTVPITSEDLTE